MGRLYERAIVRAGLGMARSVVDEVPGATMDVGFLGTENATGNGDKLAALA